MAIHQALFAGYGSVEAITWTIVDTDGGNNWNFSASSGNFQAGDLMLFIGQSDNGGVGFRFIGTSFPTTELANEEDRNSIDYGITFGRMPSGINYIQGQQQADIGMALAIRPSVSAVSYSLTIKSIVESNGDDFPDHNNVSNSLSAGSLAILIGMLDDDAINNISPPSDSTFIAMDKDSSNGTMGVAYKQIETSGNYSWGRWSTTSSATDRALAFVIEVVANQS